MSDRRRVLWFIKGLGLGGAEKLLELALPYLDRDQFDYQICYLLPWKDALVPQFQQAGISVFCLNQRKAYDLRVMPKLVSLLQRQRIDLLHMHLPYSGILGRVASKMTPVKAVVYTEHNLWERYHWLTATANRLTYSWNDAVIAVSGEVENSIRSNCRLNGKPTLSTILNGVDVEQLAAEPKDSPGVRKEFGISEHHRLVVHVANFTPKKRHSDLLLAAQTALSQDPDITFLLVGQGDLVPHVKTQAQELGIENNVVFAGFRTDAPRLMAASDLFVLSSLHEGLPVSLLEALSVGLPVVATRVGGIPEVITDGEEGFLVDPLAPEKLGQKILKVLHSPDLQRQFSRKGQELVRESFGIQRMVKSTEALYATVLSEKGVA